MAFNQNGSLPVAAINQITTSLLTAAKAPSLFDLDTETRELTNVITSYGSNLPSGTVLTFTIPSARTGTIYFYGTDDELETVQTTTSGVLTYTTSFVTKRINAKVDSSCQMEVVIKPSASTATDKIDYIRSSTTYTEGTDYATGDYAHIFLFGGGGGGGAVYTSSKYGGGSSYYNPGGAPGAVTRSAALQLSGNYPITIGTGGTGGFGGGHCGSPPRAFGSNAGNAGGTSTGFSLTSPGGPGKGQTGQYTPASPGSQPDNLIFSTGNVASDTGSTGNLQPGSRIGAGGSTSSGYSRNQGLTQGPSGADGAAVVLRYRP